MKNYPIDQAEKRRLDVSDTRIMQDPRDGAFVFQFKGVRLRVVASCGGDWDHVSVSNPQRCPTWEEMCFVKRVFFRDDETVIQYHPPEAEYVNRHNFCLHLWRPQYAELPMPPLEFV